MADFSASSPPAASASSSLAWVELLLSLLIVILPEILPWWLVGCIVVATPVPVILILVVVLPWRVSFFVSSVVVASLLSLRTLFVAWLARLARLILFGFVVSLLIVVGALMPVILLLWLVAVLAVFLPVLPASVISWWRRWRWKPRVAVLVRISGHRRHVVIILLLDLFLSVVAPRILRAIVVLLLVSLLIVIIVSWVVLPLIDVLLVLHPLVILVISLILPPWRIHLRLPLALLRLIGWSPARGSADLFESDVHKL